MDSSHFLAALVAIGRAEAALMGARSTLMSGRPGPEWSGPARWTVDTRLADLDRDLSHALRLSSALEDDARRGLRDALTRESWGGQ